MNFSPSIESATEQSITITSPLQALTLVDQKLNGNVSLDSTLRQINFMIYELSTLKGDRPQVEIIRQLNRFFFETKNFRVQTAPYFISEVVTLRAGCGMALALLYAHLAQGLGLKLEIVHWPLHTLLKWDNGGRPNFIDLEKNGETLNEDELLFVVNKHKEKVSTLNIEQALVQYLSYVSFKCRQVDDHQRLLEAQNFILMIEPKNTRFLLERALLRRELGLYKEALCDLKRYFSFTEHDRVSSDVVKIFDELKGCH